MNGEVDEGMGSKKDVKKGKCFWLWIGSFASQSQPIGIPPPVQSILRTPLGTRTKESGGARSGPRSEERHPGDFSEEGRAAHGRGPSIRFGCS